MGHLLKVIVHSEENETKRELQGKLDFPNFGMLLGQGKKLFNCWQFGDFQMTSLIGMIFSDYNVCIHWAGKATNKVILHPGTDAIFFSSLKVFVICERKKDWNYYQPLYVIHWPHVCLKRPSLGGMQAIYILFHKWVLQTYLNQIGLCGDRCILIWTRL